MTAAWLAAAALLAWGQPSRDPRAAMDFARHLRLGVDATRHGLPDSARAEFDACARLKPDDPELLFQSARLRLLPERRDEAGARSLLRRSLEKRPGSAKAHRLLAGLEGGGGQGPRHEAEFVRLEGPLGALDLAAESDGGDDLSVPEPLANQAEVADFAGALRQLEHVERAQDPQAALVSLRSLLERHRDAAALRVRFAKLALRQWARLEDRSRPDAPLKSSKLILEVVAALLEQAYDGSDPGSPTAADALYWRAQTALRMGDWDEVLALAAAAKKLELDVSRRRDLAGWEALAQMRKGRPLKAVDVLMPIVAGGAERSLDLLQYLWELRLAQEQAGVPEDRRATTFRFNRGVERDPSRSPVFYEDVAAPYHLDKVEGLGPASWGDYDGDGRYDLFLSGLDSYGMLLRNEGSAFADVTRKAGLLHAKSGFCATFADYDNDGRPDLYIDRLGWGGPALSTLYHNNGDGTFSDVTRKAGVQGGGSSFVHVWSDVDRDGNQDLFVANGIMGGAQTNTLYHNNGDGTFSDVTRKAGLKEPEGTRTIGVAVGDYDNDGWPDLFVSGFFGPNRLYHNRGDGTFDEVAAKAGVADPDHLCAGFVAFFVDYNNDGRPDILRTCEAPWAFTLASLSERWDDLPAEKKREMLKHSPRLYRNNGDGTFTDVTKEAGLETPIGVMGAMVGDLDDDGWPDIYFADGGPDLLWLETDRFFHNNGDGTFTDLTFASGLGKPGKGHGTAFIDLEGTGRLDVFVNEGGFVMGDPSPKVFYRDRKPSSNHWLEVDLEGVKSNRDAVDSRLTVKAGKLRMIREVKNGEGFGNSNPRTVHFGLGTNARVESLEVRWPSGLVQKFSDVPADRRILIREGETWKPWTR